MRHHGQFYSALMDSCCQSCERIRVALEGFEDVTEIEAFVRSYGTGAKIPGGC